MTQKQTWSIAVLVVLFIGAFAFVFIHQWTEIQQLKKGVDEAKALEQSIVSTETSIPSSLGETFQTGHLRDNSWHKSDRSTKPIKRSTDAETSDILFDIFGTVDIDTIRKTDDPEKRAQALAALKERIASLQSGKVNTDKYKNDLNYVTTLRDKMKVIQDNYLDMFTITTDGFFNLSESEKEQLIERATQFDLIVSEINEYLANAPQQILAKIEQRQPNLIDKMNNIPPAAPSLWALWRLSE